jgi:hypothetical protein
MVNCRQVIVILPKCFKLLLSWCTSLQLHRIHNCLPHCLQPVICVVYES